MNKLAAIIVLFSSTTLFSQAQENYQSTIEAFQKELNKEFKDKNESPLTKKDRRKFKALDFYPIDETYHVQARFFRTINSKPFEMTTTSDRKPVYEKYGYVSFRLNNEIYTLEVYQSHRLREMEEYKDHLFLPFKDLTCGEGSYGGGRYLDLTIPDKNNIIIDFNKAYNPYCAYNTKFSCPIVPDVNRLKVAIPAGVKAFEGGNH